MAQAGDVEAFNVLTTQVLSGNNWSNPDLLTSIEVISNSGDPGALSPPLRTMLYSKEPAVVNAAIEAIGALGDPRIASELYKLFDDADAARCIAVARALQRLDATKLVRDRFYPAIALPAGPVSVRTPLSPSRRSVIRPGGRSCTICWKRRRRVYYPLALTVLDAIPSQEGQAFITKALVGSDEEQLAAMKSISLLGAKKVDESLLAIMRDTKRSLPIRQTTVKLLAARRSPLALKDLRGMAAMIKGGSPDEESADESHCHDGAAHLRLAERSAGARVCAPTLR